MRFVGLLLIFAACADNEPSGPPPEEVMAARRAALGLRGAELHFKRAMRELQSRDVEAVLANPDAPRQDVLDAALVTEDVLAHARLGTARQRNRDPQAFQDAHTASRDAAAALARAAAGDAPLTAPKRALQQSCVTCHETFRAW